MFVYGFCLLFVFKAAGQPCPTAVNLTFFQGSNNNSDKHEVINLCGQIGGGNENDIDIYSPTNLPSSTVYHWQYSTIPSPYNWITDLSATTDQYYIGFFRNSPGKYFFRLTIDIPGCSSVTSDIVDLTVNNTGSAPSPPSTTPASNCSPTKFNIESGRMSRRYNLLVHFPEQHKLSSNTGTSYSAFFSATTTYWVSCITGGNFPSGCESTRTPVTSNNWPTSNPGFYQWFVNYMSGSEQCCL